MKSKIIVTGSSGFVGTYLTAALLDIGCEIHPLNRSSGDITLSNTWSNLPVCNQVIHLASFTDVRKSWTVPGDCINQNILGLVNCLEYCRLNNSRLIFLSTYLYGNTEVFPTPETADLLKTNPYALSKYLGEEIIQFYSEKYEVDSIVIRPFNIYGIGMSSHFMIPMLIKQALTERRIELFNFSAERDFIHVNDVVNLIVKAVDSNVKQGLVNAGSGKSFSSLHLSKLIAKNIDNDLTIEEIGTRIKGSISKTQADISSALQLFEWKPTVSLEDGIFDLVEYYKKHTK